MFDLAHDSTRKNPIRVVAEKLMVTLKLGSTLIPRRWGEGAGDVVLQNRYLIAASYLRGCGIEVGALNRPLKIPPEVKVRYVDRYSVDDLYKTYQEMKGVKIVSPDIVDDGEHLGKIGDNSQDFVIANHFIEHCEDPILTLKNFLRVLKHEGILFMAIPDRRFTFDVDRPNTAVEHLYRDHEEGAEVSRKGHFSEFVRLANLHCGKEAWQSEAEYEAQVKYLMDTNYSIHYHVWDFQSMMVTIPSIIERYSLPGEVMLAMSNNEEVIWILRKT